MELKIKEKIIKKFNRKTGDYDREINLFEKYTVGNIYTSNNGWKTIQITGPKQTFVLCSTAKPLKVCRPGKPVQELPFFFVIGETKCTKIQGAAFFALDGNVLIPYRSDGRGLVCEL